MPEIRRLVKEDAAEVYALRLRALQEHPEAFGASYEDEVTHMKSRWETALADANRACFGGFHEGKLAGMVIISRNTGRKVQHVTNINSMYVASEARKLGLGQALISACIDHAKSLEGVKQIGLAVTVSNDNAGRLYRRNGFVTWGVQAEYIILEDGSAYDIEWMTLQISD